MTTLTLPSLNETFFNIEPEPNHVEPSFQQLQDELRSLLQQINTTETDINQLQNENSEIKVNNVALAAVTDGLQSDLNKEASSDPIESIIKKKYGNCAPSVQSRQRKRLQKEQALARKKQRFTTNNPNLYKQKVSVSCPWKELQVREDHNSFV